MKPSLLIGRIAGTEIRLHWTLLLIFPYVILTFRPQTLLEGVRDFILIAVVFISVLLHELGHLVLARGYGVRVSSVVLWLLGGGAVIEREPDDPGAQLMIAAAGPLVNLLIVALLLIVLAVSMLAMILKPGAGLPFTAVFPLNNYVFIIITNAILAISNLLPIYPLDGGRIFKALVQMAFGQARSNAVTLWISLALTGALLIWALIERSWLVAGTALLLALGASSLNQTLGLNGMRLYARLTRQPEIFIRLADFDPAVEILTRRIDQTPGDARLFLQRALTAYFLEDFTRARADAERVLWLESGNVQALMLRGAISYAMDLPDNSWDALAQLEQARPAWAMVYLNRAILLRDANRLGEALEQINLALPAAAADPAMRSAALPLLVRSSISFGQGDLESARRDWAEAVRLTPRDATIFSPDRVRIFAHSWAWAEAYFAWLEVNVPDRAVLAVAHGEVALRAGESARAVEKFGEAIRLYPVLRDLSYYRGLAYLQLGERALAHDDFNTAQQVTRRAHIRRFAAARLRALASEGAV